MEKFEDTIGRNILSLLLSLADDKGQIPIDKTTFLPLCHRSNDITLRKLGTLMHTSGIIPDEDIDKEGYDFLQNFVSESISEERKNKIIKLFLKYEGDSQANRDSLLEVLSNWNSRFAMFKFLFVNRKKIDGLAVDEPNFRVWDEKVIPLYHCKVIRDIIFHEKINPLCKQLEKLLVLLMGEYAEQEFYPYQFDEKSKNSGIDTKQNEIF